jgi:pre-mRNA-processing factor 39
MSFETLLTFYYQQQQQLQLQQHYIQLQQQSFQPELSQQFQQHCQPEPLQPEQLQQLQLQQVLPQQQEHPVSLQQVFNSFVTVRLFLTFFFIEPIPSEVLIISLQSQSRSNSVEDQAQAIVTQQVS